MIVFGVLISSFVQLFAITAITAYSQYVVLRAGVFSLATAGYALIGAYTAAALQVRLDMPVLPSSILALAAGVFAGWLIGFVTRKLRGVYQAIASLAFVIVVQQLAQLWTSVTGGPGGLIGIPNWAGTPQLVIMLVVVSLAIWAIDRSITGFQMSACRIDEVAAASLGVNDARHRLIASMISGGLGALGGVAQAANQFAITPDQFGFPLAVSALVAVVVGSYRFWLGPLVGVFVFEAILQIIAPYSGYAALTQGVLMLVVILFMPEGIVGSLKPIIGRMGRRLRSRTHGERHGVAGASNQLDVRADSLDRSLTVDSIQRSYSGIKAVEDVSVQVSPGQIVGLIGPNGAGKSTVINLVAGHSRLDAGTVSLGEQRIDELRQFEVARAGVVRTFQTCRLFNELTVLENIELAALRTHSRQGPWRALLPVSQEARRAAVRLVTEVGATDLADRNATTLTYSDQRRVEVARALALSPSFLLLDEPAAGMRENEAEDLGALIRQLGQRGVGVLVVDHNVAWILGLCSHVVVQQLGRVIAAGDPAMIRDNPAVQAAYLGTVEHA